MPATMMSVFSHASDLEEALRSAADIHLIVTGRGEFRARLTRVDLQRLRLWVVCERVPRIGFLRLPSDMLLALFTVGDKPSPIWSGLSLKKEEILICSPSH